MLRESGLPVVFSSDDHYEWTKHWQDASDPPNHNGPVWGYCPSIGNEDDGYGYIEVVRCLLDGFDRTKYSWVNAHGNPSPVTHWACLDNPEPPFPPSDTSEEAKAIACGLASSPPDAAG